MGRIARDGLTRSSYATILLSSTPMLRADPLAYRPGAVDEGPDAVAAVGPTLPRPVPVLREPSGVRLRRLSASMALATIIHLGFTGLFLVLWRTMPLDEPTREPPSAEFIVLPPGEDKPPRPPAAAPPPAAAVAKAPPPPAPPASPPAAPPTRTPPDLAPPEPPRPSALDEALKPGLLEPPPEAKAAATQAVTNQAGNASPSVTEAQEGATGTPSAPPTPEPAEPVAAPEVLTTAASAMTVPAPAHGRDAPAPPTAGDPTQAGRTASEQLAAALPLSAMPMPLSFRAALSAEGTSSNAAYRGSVFGALERAREGATQQAQARRLKGQVVLAIVLTATGGIDKVSIVQSSGSAAADAFAIDMVKRAAPFPPPPPGASRTFTPAIAFGNG